MDTEWHYKKPKNRIDVRQSTTFILSMQIFVYGILRSIQPWKVNTTKRKDFLESKMESVFPVMKYYANEVIKHAILFIYLFIYTFFF